MSNENRDNAKIVIVLRTARSALKLNLKEMGGILEIAPSTVGKLETGDLLMKAATYMRLQRYIEQKGIAVKFGEGDSDEVLISFKSNFIDAQEARLSKDEEVNTLFDDD